MKKIITLTVAVIVFFCISFNKVFGQEPNAEYKQVLMEYMQLSGSDAPLNAAFEQMVKMMGLTNEQEAQVMANVKEKAMSDLWNRLVPLYEKHISLDDLRAAADFYRAPAGQRLASSTAVLSAESQQVGMAWGMKLAEMIQAELQK